MNSTLRSWVPELRPLFGIIGVLFVLTSVVYPLLITGIAQVAFSKQANGSIIDVAGVAVASSLVGQQFVAPQYFHGRPSAAGDGYDAAASGGSNLGPTSSKLLDGIEDDPATEVDESYAGIRQRVRAFREENGLAADAGVPADAVTASGSGLDPHISPATARLQTRRVAEARGTDEASVRALVEEFVEEPALRIIGEPRVNVVKLNLALDQRFPMR